MKKLLCLTLAFVLCLGLFAGCNNEPVTPTQTTPTNPASDPAADPSTEPVVDNSAMMPELTALELVHMMGNGTNLGNTMEACNTNAIAPGNSPLTYEVSWGQPVTTQEMLYAMKESDVEKLQKLADDLQ